MKYRLAVWTLLAVGALAGQQRPLVSVTELPPEPFLLGSCTQSKSGYLAIEKGNETTKPSDSEIGEYVRVRLSEGYSVSLYPQLSGRIFAIATCEAVKR